MARPSDDLERLLDGFAARVEAHWLRTERRIARRALDRFWDRPTAPTGISLSALKPSLDDYDHDQK